MSLKEQMLRYFEQPEVHAAIIDYVARHQLDPEALDNPTLLRILEELQLLDPLHHQVQQ
jgi:hypothetical protein